MSKRAARIRSRVRVAGQSGAGSRLDRIRESSNSGEPQISLEQQYQYVKRDLARIGVIAAMLVGGLVALSFFLK